MSDGVPITVGIGTLIYSDDLGAAGHAQRIKRLAGGDGSGTDFLDVATRSDTFTGTGNGTAYNVSAQGVSSYSISVKGAGGAPTSWTANLQISLDNVNWTTILVHSNTSPPADDIRVDGQTISTGANRYVGLYFRTNVSALVLGGSATNIAVITAAMPV